jgi:hypothetical protein
MSRYFYGPIDTGSAAAGASIAQAMGQTVNAFQQKKAEDEEKRRYQDEIDFRNKQAEVAERERQRENDIRDAMMGRVRGKQDLRQAVQNRPVELPSMQPQAAPPDEHGVRVGVAGQAPRSVVIEQGYTAPGGEYKLAPSAQLRDGLVGSGEYVFDPRKSFDFATARASQQEQEALLEKRRAEIQEMLEEVPELAGTARMRALAAAYGVNINASPVTAAETANFENTVAQGTWSQRLRELQAAAVAQATASGARSLTAAQTIGIAVEEAAAIFNTASGPIPVEDVAKTLRANPLYQGLPDQQLEMIARQGLSAAIDKERSAASRNPFIQPRQTRLEGFYGIGGRTANPVADAYTGAPHAARTGQVEATAGPSLQGGVAASQEPQAPAPLLHIRGLQLDSAMTNPEWRERYLKATGAK